MRRLVSHSINICRVVFGTIVIGGLVLSSISFGYSGGSGTAEEPYQIDDVNDLLTLAGTVEDYNKCFILTSDINMEGQVFTTAIIAADTSSSDGFQGTAFKGAFDGNDHTISNFTFNTVRPDYIGSYYVGLFGYVDGNDAEIKDLRLMNTNVEGYFYVGALIGRLQDGTVTGCGIESGSVSGNSSYVGGLAGYNDHGTISDCCAASVVLGNSYIGGLAGYNDYGTISNCYAAGSVAGYYHDAGGLAGYNYYGTISDCYATGDVIGDESVGGLVGKNTGTILSCYATGDASGESKYSYYIGGLIGDNFRCKVIHCYSTGKPTGGWNVGGLCGRVDVGGDHEDSGNFWDTQTSETTTSAMGTGKTTAEMQTFSTFADAEWDFLGETTNGTDDIWRMCIDGVNYPLLWWQFNTADFVCPDGVEINDLAVLCEQWLLEKLSADVAPDGGDGVVNFLDWSVFADGWQSIPDIDKLIIFVEQWLQRGAYCADIAPALDGDGIVNLLDFAALANNWMAGQ